MRTEVISPAGSLGQRHRLVGFRIQHGDDGLSIVVEARHAITATVREVAVANIPGRLFYILMSSAGQMIATHTHELVTVVGQVIQPLAGWIKRGKLVVGRISMRRDVLEFLRCHTVQIEVAVRGGIRLGEYDRLIGRDDFR